ncbi:MAG: hypothetical protein FWH32_06020 [Clostridiales bacterium]|nr:hypothetical protein [Clostridiales bacterium]
MTDRSLAFDPGAYALREVEVDGKMVRYRAWEGIVYVARPVAAAEMRDKALSPTVALTNFEPVPGSETLGYHSLNIYAPEGVTGRKPAILLRTYAGYYMPALPGEIGKELFNDGRDFTARALAEGYVVVSPGSRGSTSVAAGDHGHYIGRAPSVIVDLKAAIRYLRHNAELLPGDTESIITDGWSAGGASSALLAVTGNDKAYEPYLREIGAADERDDVFAAMSFCPITDMENSDTAYEWLYHGIDATPDPRVCEVKGWADFTERLRSMSEGLRGLYPAYIESLDMVRTDTGERLTADNYLEYIGYFLRRSAQKELDSGGAVPPETGIVIEGGRVAGIDMGKYLSFLGRWSPIKDPPAYDNLGISGKPDGSFENLLFGDERERALNFTDWALRTASGDTEALVAESVKERVRLMNAMRFLGPENAENAGRSGEKDRRTMAKHVFLRHGSFDRDTSFTVPINLYTKMNAAGISVDFEFAWGYMHAGDYGADEAFAWMRRILAEAEDRVGAVFEGDVETEAE